MQTKNLITSTVTPLLIDNIDTDQIIPARYLKIVDKSGLGERLFADWRYDQTGAPKPDFILNKPGAATSKILLAGENFGCGSSREHAPWALRGFGFQVIIARSFADIFKNNSVKNNLLTIALPEKDHEILVDTVLEIPDMLLEVDIVQEKLRLPTGVEINFSVDQFTKRAILDGTDEMQYLLGFLPVIEEYEAAQAGK